MKQARAPFSFPDSVLLLQETGMFSPIDLHLASFVARLENKDDALLTLGTALLSRHTSQGNICLDLSRMDAALVRELRTHGIAWPDQATWLKRLGRALVVGRPGEDRPLILDGFRLYMKRYFDYETELASSLTRLARERITGIDMNRLGQGLNRYFPDTRQGGFWQKVAAFAAVTRRLCVISGGPGTGKTTTVAKILALILEQSPHPLRIALAAPTGKAAARLGDSLQGAGKRLHLPEGVGARMPTAAVTLHRLLGWVSGSPEFRHNRDNPLNVDLLVLDEVSMVDLPLMAKTVRALPDHARLILLGDRDQLASVEAGAVLGDICGQDRLEVFSLSFVRDYAQTVGAEDNPDEPLPESGPERGLLDTVVPLTKSYRFREDSGIKALSLAIRHGDGARALEILHAGLPDISWINTQTVRDPASVVTSVIQEGYVPAYVSREVKTRYDLLQRFRILSPVHDGARGTVMLNKLVGDILQAQGVMQRHALWPEGLLVMVSVNDYGVRLYNGDIGLVALDAKGRPHIHFPDQEQDSMRSIAPVRLPAHEPAFAMTVHKSQGSEFDHVLLVLPDADSPVLTRELLYTAITRAREKVTLVGDPEMIVRAVGRRIQRGSGLGRRLLARG
ncbi:exodeoxyribonuclease V subunit alpha [Desulfoplanes formicivorans]|nr:exodeoxyribonuclease V subunit alpha [Desulfoplanes formicivorans]